MTQDPRMDRGGAWFGTEEPQVRLCEFPGCDEPASHRAPRTPTDLRTYRWFCLGHVRDYNRSWNFFEGWNQGDIERFQRDDMTGHRPTWPFGQKGEHDRDDLEAVFHAFKHEWFGEGPDANGSQRKAANGASGERRDALALLNLAPPFDLTELKQRYKSLVKQHHPDANGGSRESEELLKRINHAYNYLKKECS